MARKSNYRIPVSRRSPLGVRMPGRIAPRPRRRPSLLAVVLGNFTGSVLAVCVVVGMMYFLNVKFAVDVVHRLGVILGYH